jgi:hypothetical protein
MMNKSTIAGLMVRGRGHQHFQIFERARVAFREHPGWADDGLIGHEGPLKDIILPGFRHSPLYVHDIFTLAMHAACHSLDKIPRVGRAS